MSPLLENAITSIQLGLEDFNSDDERRIISAARNLYAGVLLLCKEVLRQLSPPDSNDLLISVRKKIVRSPDGAIRFIGDGKKTVDRLEIEETFKQLGLSVSLSKLSHLAGVRNDIEHMHPKLAPALIQEAVADAMPIVRDLIVKELKEDPSDLLGAEAWDTLLKEARVFDEEQKACRSSFDQLNWGTATLENAFQEFQCPSCSSKLLRNENANATEPGELELICSKCGTNADIEDVIEAALQESLWVDNFLAAKDGGESVLEDCPECDRETYAVNEGECLNPCCSFSVGDRECAVCGEGLSLDEYRYGSDGLCSYHAHGMSKDD